MFAILFAVVGILPPIQPMSPARAVHLRRGQQRVPDGRAVGPLPEGVTVGELASGTEASIDVDATVDDLVSRMFADRRTQFVVTENGTPVGVVSAVDFKALSPEERATTTVDALVERDLPRFEAGMAAFDALIELDGNRTTEALVEDAAGTRVITRADFAAAMEMRRLVGTHEPF